MRFLTDEDFERFKSDREQIRGEVAERIASMDLEQHGLHELVLLRDGFQAQADACEGHIANVVAHLRAIESSWAEIGKVLGISKQAAQQRYGDKTNFTVRTLK